MLFKNHAGTISPAINQRGLLLKTFVLLSFFSLSFIGRFHYFPAPSVVTELRLNEGTGTATADASGNAHNGTLTNGPTWGPGKYGQGINLDGSNDYINLADHADYTLTPTVSYTWSAWVRNNNFNQWSTVWSQTLSSSSFFYFYAHSSSDAEAGPVTNGISVYWYSGSSKLVLHSNNNVLTAGTWSYVTVTYDASQAQASRFTIFINGADVTNRSDVVSSGTLAAIDPTNIRIGSNQPYGEYLNGSVDEVRYYRRLLSVSEIQADMNIGNSPLPDTQAPTTNITAPAAGNVSGTINVNANASDDVGVAGVQFLLDGNNLGAEDVTNPYSVSWNTTTATAGNHTLTARARDAAGNTTTSASVIVNVNNDVTAPTINITAPAAGNVSGTINVNANASDNVGVAGVQYLLDGNNLGTEDVTNPYSVSWNTTTATAGNHTLTARARDAAGNTTTSASVIVNVNNDVTAPTINITAPAAGNVLGTINVTANASDNVGVAGVQFLLDGNNLGTEDITNPYSVSWNTTTISNGSHTLTAKARDAAGNTTTSSSVIVNVNNDVTAPTINITAPAAGDVVGTINVTANASDNVGVTGVQFLLDGNNLGTEDVSAPYSISWNTTTAGNGSHNISARARDAAGNNTISVLVGVNVNNDITAPTVSVDAPVSSPVSGTINVTATANDNAGVAGVQFLLDGNNLGAEDVTAPYSVSWSTTTASNGNHNITARARDAAGNTTTSAIVPFNVFNNGLVAAYGFNENTGTVANDNSGNGNAGTLTNGPTWSASGKYGAAILFDGTDDFVNISDANSLDLTNGMTIEAWVNASNLTGYKTAICKENGSGNLVYALSPNNSTSGTSNQRPNTRIRIGTTTTTVTGTTKLSLNTWAHIASTYDGAVLRFYINGTQVATANVTGSMANTTNPLRIGGTTALAQYFTGLIDEVRIYNRALSQGEIQTDMNTPVAPDVTSPAVNITAPAAGNVSGTINVTANATDNISVAGVQFLVDGNNLGTEDLTNPYSVSWNTTTIANGSHTLTARGRDAAGNTATSTDVIVNVNNDLVSPTINITAPAAGTIAGNVDITADANDNTGVIGVQFLLNGVNLGAEDITAPYSFTWNTNTVADGNYTLTAKARDAGGNVTTSSSVVVNVLNHPPDTEFPTVSITSPQNGEIVGTVNINADANDNVGIVGVQFLLNGNNFGAEQFSPPPYSISWNTLTVANGMYTLTAKARDAAGNITTSPGTMVMVNNPPDNESPTVSIVAPPPGNVSGTVDINVNASDNIGVTKVQFFVDGNPFEAQDSIAPYSLSWNTRTVNNGTHTLTATAIDAAGNVGTSADVIVTVNNDQTPPTINITAPPPGSVSGTININATASDNVGVVGVQFLLDGTNFGAEDLTAPYSISWSTNTAVNGSHVLVARARDAEGNITTSPSVVVTVNNVSNLLTAINFNEGTGTNAADLSGNNHNGTLTSGPTWTPGKYGQGVNLNGTSNYVNIADHNDYTLDPAQNYTWSAWVKNTSFKEWSTVWSQTINNSNFFYFYAHTSTDPDGGPVTNGISVYWWINGGGSKLAAHSSNNVLTTGQWSFIAVTYNASQPQNNRFTIYVNGVDVTDRADVTSAGTLTAINPTNVRIGSNQPFGEYLNGAVDEVRYYNRLLSLAEVQTDMNTPIGIDNTAPAVSISAPANNSSVSGTTNVTANASDNVGIAGVQFLLDGNNLGAEDVSTPYSVSWNTTTATNGTHTLTARARDAAGNTTTSTNIVVVVDNIAPTINITAPAAGTVNGNVDINANANDNRGVAGVQFLLNGNNLGSEDLLAPYSFTWNTNTVTDGNYTLTARARDTAGNITTSSSVVVNVLNHPPDAEFPTVNITAPSAGEVLGTINVTANANDNIAVVGVQFLLNGNNLGAEDQGAPYSVSWNTLTIANGSYTLTAKARDAAGNVTTSAPIVVTVNNPPDSELPVVNITAPSAGNVLGTINVTANASDNAGVVGVQFLLNGNNLGSEDLTAPYSISWNTTTIANGTYTLTANARDAAGNIGSSSDVIVTVNNDVTAPTINITSPAGGNVSGTINVTANATDNVGVVGVQFLLDGNNLGAEDVTAPYSVSWNTFLSSNGSHIVSARARDAAGNISLATDVNITVANTNPVISGIGIATGSITESSAIINWTTNIPATSQVNYGTTAAYGFSTLVDSAMVTSHSQILNGLNPGTVYHYQVLSGNSGGSPSVSGDNTFTTASLAATLGTINTHTVFAYPTGKIVPWTPNPTNGYDTVMDLAWNYLLNTVPNDPSTGKPAYYSRSYINPNTQQMVDWPHNPAGLYGMLIESGIKYYGYSGNTNVMQLANDVAIWHLDHGMTLVGDNWSNVPYSEGQSGSTTYGGAPQDGVGVLEPDKIGELGYGWLQLYKYNGNTRFRDAAIQAATVLSNRIRVGNTTQSPWPYRVNAHTGSVVENYCSNIIGPISLFDGLIAAGLGDTALYRTTRNAAWTWMMTFPMQNNVWAQYFEDVGIQGSYNSNLNQYNAMMVARYLLEHPEFDANWEAHVRGLILWVESIFLQTQLGANTIREQQVFNLAMGSHTSRYASVNALLYEKTGDTTARNKAYRAFNWATYMCRSNGISIDGPDINNQWFTDGYGDYIRHFMTGVGAVREWTPANQTHLVRSSSVIKNILYGSNTLSYTTYDIASTEVLHISYNPVSITANGVVLPHRSDLSQPGWTLDVATKTLKIYHTNATQIVINPGSPGGKLIVQQMPAADSVDVSANKIDNNKKYHLVEKVVDETNAKELVILPNPASGNFVLNYTAQDKGTAVIRITSIDGKLVFITNKSVTKGQNIIYMQSGTSWKPGVYIINVQQGKTNQQGKLVYQ